MCRDAWLTAWLDGCTVWLRSLLPFMHRPEPTTPCFPPLAAARARSCRPRLRAAEEHTRQLEAELAARDDELAAELGELHAQHQALLGECERWRAAAQAAGSGGDGGGRGGANR